MDIHAKVMTGKSEVWSIGMGYDPQGCINFDFIRWYLIITWHKEK